MVTPRPLPQAEPRPSAWPLLELARGMIHGHRMIAERVREHAEEAHRDLAITRAAHGARRAAEALAAPSPGHE